MKRLIFFLIIASSSLHVQGQDQVISMKINSKEIKMGEIFTIILTIQNSEKWETGDFPEIVGFSKAGKSVSHASIIKNGQRIAQHIIRQNYLPKEPGIYKLSKNDLVVNAKIYVLEEYTINVSGEDKIENQINTEFSNIPITKEDVFLFLLVNKKNYYAGEGIYINLAFYVSAANTTDWKFPENLTEYLDKIGKSLIPKNALINQQNIKEIKGIPTNAKGKDYIRYTLHEAVYYPLNEGSITFPAISFPITKWLKNKDDSLTRSTLVLSTKAFMVNVLPLPDHPLKQKVAVGNLSLQNLFKTRTAETGKILNFSFKINGKGNFSTMLPEMPLSDENFDFFPPTFQTSQNNLETGSKTFTYKIFPKDSGNFNLGNYFHFIYFNVIKGDYDTLKFSHNLKVSGKKIKTTSSTIADIYQNIEKLSVSEKEIDFRRIIKIMANIILILMLAGMLFIFDFKIKS